MALGNFGVVNAAEKFLSSRKMDFHAHAILPSYVEGLKKLGIDAPAEEGFPLPKWLVDEHLKFMDTRALTIQFCQWQRRTFTTALIKKKFPAKLHGKSI